MPRPKSGRTYTRTRPVRLTDTSPKGRVRFDALARYLQDVANDDATEVLGDDAQAWIVRRTVMEVARFPVLADRLELTTWASGLGSRWAERRTSILGPNGARVETASLWVHVDLASGRPVRLNDSFHVPYEEAAGGRTVHARLRHPGPPVGELADTPDVATVAWTPRFTDFDVLGHVNNTVYWAVVEECLPARAPCRVELEYRGGISRDDEVAVVVAGDRLWILADGTVAASVFATDAVNSVAP